MAGKKQFSTFVVDRLLFGVEVEKVQEVIRYQAMTGVPLAPPVVKGLINLRGQIVTAIDLRRRLGLRERAATDLPMNVVIRHDDGAVSLLVDEIGDVLEVEDESFEPPPETLHSVSRQLIRGVYKLSDRLMHVLDTGVAVSVVGDRNEKAAGSTDPTCPSEEFMHHKSAAQPSPFCKRPALALLVLIVGLSFLGVVDLRGQTVTATAPPAASKNPADSLNRDLPKWMRFNVEFRSREEGRTSFSFNEGVNDTYTLTRMRLGLDLKPSKWFHLFVQGQDSRVMDIDKSRATSSLKNTFDLRQGYVELKAGEKNWASLQVGRSELNLGNQRLVGGGDWGNVTRTFDVAKIGVGAGGNRVDIFAATPVVVYTNRFDTFGSAPGQNLYGVYGTLSKLVPKATIEPYVLWKTNPLVKSETGLVGNADIYSLGALWFGTLPAGFDYTVEMDRQGGHLSNDNLSSWAGYWIAGYTLPKVPLTPRFSTEYTYASGDRNKGDGKVSTFDQVYGAFHNIYGMSDLFGWRNVRHLRTSVEVKPSRTVKVTFDYHFLWLASAHDGVYNASGVQVVKAPIGGALHNDIGHDADCYVTYNPRPWLTVGTGWSYLFWGRILKENATGIGSSYPWVFLTYRL